MTINLRTQETAYWIERYELLKSLLADIHNQDGLWTFHLGDNIAIAELSEDLPIDLRAYLHVFGLDGQIGVSGMAVVGVDLPETHENSDIYQTYYSMEVEDDQQTFGDTGVPISVIQWFAYTASAVDVIGYYKKDNAIRIVGTFLGREMATFEEFLCYQLSLHCEEEHSLTKWIEASPSGRLV